MIDPKASRIRLIFKISLIFTALFFLFELTVFSHYRGSAFQYLSYVLKTGFWLKYFVMSTGFWAISAGSLLIFIFLSLLAPLVFRIIYFLIFSATVIFEYGYQGVFDRFSILPDLKIVLLTTPAQQLDGVFAYFNWLALIPCLAYLILLLTVNRRGNLPRTKSAAVFVLFLATVSFCYLAIFFAAPRITTYNLFDDSFGNNHRILYGYLFSKFHSLPDQRQKVRVPEQKTAQNNVIVIADESTRGDHLSLNGYGRPTTPFLESLSRQGILHNWGIASSGSTRSLESFQYLITGIKADDLTDIPKKINESPTMFQYAKAMGYKTYYFDGQMNDYWGGNPEDLKAIDTVVGVSSINPNGEPGYDNDFKIAEKVNQIISGSAGNFVFIFKHGNHTPYNKNFPSEKAEWTPFSAADPPFGLENFNQQSFVNAYDDGIKYNLDKFFQTLAPDYANLPNGTVIIYTGDHGQTLSENGENYPHGKSTAHEANVPLFMIGDLKTPVDISYKAEHANIFATVLDLIGYPENLREGNYAPALLKATGADSKPRYFIAPNNGNGLVYDESLKIPFDK